MIKKIYRRQQPKEHDIISYKKYSCPSVIRVIQYGSEVFLLFVGKKISLKFLQLRKCNLIPDLVRKEKNKHNREGKSHSFPTISQWCCQFWCCQFPEMGFLNRNLELFSNFGKCFFSTKFGDMDLKKLDLELLFLS